MERFPHGSAVTAELGSKAMGARRNDPLRDVVLKLEGETITSSGLYWRHGACADIESLLCQHTQMYLPRTNASRIAHRQNTSTNRLTN